MAKYIRNELLKAISLTRKILSKFNNKNISEGSFLILTTIEENGIPNKDGIKWIKMAELATILNMSQSALTKNTKGLEKSGYIQKANDPVDRRSKKIALTDNGFIKLEEAKKTIYDFPDELIEKLGKEEASNLVRLLNKVSDIYRKGRMDL